MGRALLDVREEVLIMAALLLGAIAVLSRDDGTFWDTRLWAGLLVVQALPYLAALVMSVIGAAPRISGNAVSRFSKTFLPDDTVAASQEPAPSPVAASQTGDPTTPLTSRLLRSPR